jgi:hypothetical protein
MRWGGQRAILQADNGMTPDWRAFVGPVPAQVHSAQILDEALLACANICDPERSPCIRQGEPGEAKEAGVPFTADAAMPKPAALRPGTQAC